MKSYPRHVSEGTKPCIALPTEQVEEVKIFIDFYGKFFEMHCMYFYFTFYFFIQFLLIYTALQFEKG